MLEEDQKEHERIEANIRSCLDNANKWYLQDMR